MKSKICFLSIDVEEDLRTDSPKTFQGVEQLGLVLDIFRKYQARATLFVTGEVLENYPDLAKKWSKSHEIGCHGYFHQPLSQLPILEREKGLREFMALYQQVFNKPVKGFRAVQNVIDNMQIAMLEHHQFAYDSSVVPAYPLFKKYIGYQGRAPKRPYYPNEHNYRQHGKLKILEIPMTPQIFGIPLVGTWLRGLGVGFYKLLFAIYQPRFISFSMHSWDGVKASNVSPKNRGEKYLQQLDEMLAFLQKRGYEFVSGEDVCNKYHQPLSSLRRQGSRSVS